MTNLHVLMELRKCPSQFLQRQKSMSEVGNCALTYLLLLSKEFIKHVCEIPNIA